MKKKLLIIEPHSDDSIIAAGGFLLKYKDEYDLYFCLVCASDLSMYHGTVSRNERMSEYRNYVEYFNGTWVRPHYDSHEFPLDIESKLDLVNKSTLVKLIENAIHEVKPDVLMFMGPSFHHDHTLVYESVIAATRPTFSWSPATLYVLENPTYIHDPYPIISFTPNTYVELDESTLALKCELFDSLFPSQIRPSGNYLSKQGLRMWAQYRGIEARCEFAEAFTQFFLRI
jgi:LmbE family N-acetylglucosaminyl deacetylase